MIYIVSQVRDFNILEKMLRQSNKEYSYIAPNEKELNELIDSKEYEAIFLSNEYRQCIKKERDFIYIKDGEIVYEELLYLGFEKFLNDNLLDLNDKTILILGSEKKARIIYKVLKKLYKIKVFIASITEDTMNLEAGDRRIKKVEIFNLREVDLIINTTVLGSRESIHESMLDGKSFVKSRMVMDLVYDPEYTSLLLRYKQKKSKIFSGLEIEKKKYEIALNFLENEKTEE